MASQRKDPWLVAARKGEQVGEVAARTLAARLAMVRCLLMEAAVVDDGGETIHKLRVGVRRCEAAIVAFKTLLPRQERRQLAKRLEAMRRAAGKARDLDVLVARLRAGGHQGGKRSSPAAAKAGKEPTADGGGLARAIDLLLRGRRAARKLIRAEWRESSRKEWRRRSTRLLDGIGGRKARDLFDRFARRQLEKISRRFLEAAAGRPRDVEALHALRIRAKKTRYAVEIFGGVITPARRSALHALLARFQDLAGECTDRVSAARRLARLAKAAVDTVDRRAFASLSRAESRAAEKARTRLVAWLTPGRVKKIGRWIRPDDRS